MAIPSERKGRAQEFMVQFSSFLYFAFSHQPLVFSRFPPSGLKSMGLAGYTGDHVEG